MGASRGFLYVATGRVYVDEAARSAATYRALMPSIPIALVKDRVTPVPGMNPFSDVLTIENPSFSFEDKILPLKASPYDLTVFVDTDTHCVAPCEDLFDVLERFDCAAAHAPYRLGKRHPERVPDAFAQLNTGVIAYRNTPAFGRFVDDWYATYRRFGLRNDQPAFRDALYRSSLDFCALPPEYNQRTCYSYIVGGNARNRILHDRGESLAAALKITTRPPGKPWVVRVGRPAARTRRVASAAVLAMAAGAVLVPQSGDLTVDSRLLAMLLAVGAAALGLWLRRTRNLRQGRRAPLSS